MPDNRTFFSQNCQGLGNPQKRRALFRHVRAKNIILFVSKMYISGVNKNPMSKLNGGTMLILVVLIAPVEAY